MNERLSTISSRWRKVLAGRDLDHLIFLLVPVFVFSIIFRIRGVVLRDPEADLWSVLWLLRSDLLFDLGFALFWVGVFVVFRRGIGRLVAAALLHVSAALLVIVSVFAYSYLDATGTTLDYGIVAYYAATPEEATGAMGSESSVLIWAVVALAVLYALVGPLVVSYLVSKFGRRSETSPDDSAPSGGLTRRRFIVAGAGLGAGALLFRGSLIPPSADGKGRLLARSAVPNLVATGMEEAKLDAAAASVGEVTDLRNIRFALTGRTRKLHIALIHLESVRHYSTSPYNRDLATTPYLTELARNSLLVERSYTTTPHTSKAVTSLHAGLPPNPDTEITESFPGGIPARCLAELLGDHGYRSAWFQSATETFENRAQHVKNFGYGHFEAYEQMPTDGFQWSNYLGYEDDIMLGPSRRWLEENASDPTLVMYLGVTPHHEYRPVDRYGRERFASGILDKYLNNIYYDDFWTRNIIEQYRELGIYEDTIFIIYGDHGEAFGEHGVKGHDGVPYEEGLRTPLIVHAPAVLDGGGRISRPVQISDFPPTIADMLGFDVVDGVYPGVSFLEEPPEDRVLRFSCRPDIVSLARIEGPEKYIYHYGKQPEELYDLARDPWERNNLAAGAGTTRLTNLREDLLEWHARSSALYADNPTSDA